MNAFKRVSIVPSNHPALSAGTENRQWAVDYCEAAQRAGIDEIQVNFLSMPLHPILLEDPTRVYHWFSDYAASLDMFAVSRLFRGVYPTPVIAANFERMQVLAEEALNHALKPFIYCAEPRFVPERFFLKRPDLRGPRVDNPKVGMTPYYALCTDKKEVREHYQEMIAIIMERIPQITMLGIFTTDSGSGFCYDEGLYAGPNGPGHCRGISHVDRIVTFCTDILETARSFNSEFEVHLLSSISPRVRAEIAARKVDGIRLPVYGLHSWTGGLEDQWSYHQYGAKIKEVGYEKARKEREADIRERVNAVSVNEDDPWALCDLPTLQYFAPIRYVPQPFEILRILRTYKDMGVKNLSLRGILSNEKQIKYDINAEVFAAFRQAPEKDDTAILTTVLEKWDASEIQEPLTQAWAYADEAVRQRPLWNLSFGQQEHLVVGPLVPDINRLSSDELAYYDNICFDEAIQVGGKTYFLPDLGDTEEYAFAIGKYETHTLPLLKRACILLEEALRSARSEQEHILKEQLLHLQLHHSHITSQYHWVQMASLMHGFNLDETAQEIVENEIGNTEYFIALLDNQPARYLHMAALKGCMYLLDPDVIDQLKARIRVMQNHSKDPVAAI